MILWQDAEKARQRRSRVVQILNVPQRVASGLHSLRPCWTAFLSILLAHILRLDVGYYSRNQRRGCGLTGAWEGNSCYVGETPLTRRALCSSFDFSEILYDRFYAMAAPVSRPLLPFSPCSPSSRLSSCCSTA